VRHNAESTLTKSRPRGFPSRSVPGVGGGGGVFLGAGKENASKKKEGGQSSFVGSFGRKLSFVRKAENILVGKREKWKTKGKILGRTKDTILEYLGLLLFRILNFLDQTARRRSRGQKRTLCYQKKTAEGCARNHPARDAKKNGENEVVQPELGGPAGLVSAKKPLPANSGPSNRMSTTAKVGGEKRETRGGTILKRQASLRDRGCSGRKRSDFITLNKRGSRKVCGGAQGG